MPYEFVSGFDAELGALERAHPHIAPHFRSLRRKLKQAAESEAALAARAAMHPMLTEREPGPGMELPFPVGTVTLAASSSGNISNNVQAVAYRILRLIMDEASATGSPQQVAITDIKLSNISQNVAAANQLVSFYGPEVKQTPFKGMTLNQNAQALIALTNLDGGNSRNPYATLFGNAVR